MHKLRKAGQYLLQTFVFITLVVSITASSVAIVVGNSENIKSALQSSGIYERVVPAIVSQQTSGKTDEVPLDNPELKKLVEQTFTPKLIQNTSDQVIDGAYKWLEGETATLTFSIDLTHTKGELAKNIRNYTETRFNSLPPCTPDQQVTPDSVDLFRATCMPPGFDVQAAAVKAEQEIQRSEFLSNTTINADTLKSAEGKSLSDQFAAAPSVFQWLERAPFILLAAITALALLIVFMGSDRLRGMRHLAWVLLPAGILVALAAWLGSYEIRQLADKVGSDTSANQELAKLLFAALLELGDKVRNTTVMIGLFTATIGAGLFGFTYFYHKKHSSRTTDTAQPPQETDIPQPPTPDTPKAVS